VNFTAFDDEQTNANLRPVVDLSELLIIAGNHSSFDPLAMGAGTLWGIGMALRFFIMQEGGPKVNGSSRICTIRDI